jgi:hypothetical protein
MKVYSVVTPLGKRILCENAAEWQRVADWVDWLRRRQAERVLRERLTETGTLLRYEEPAVQPNLNSKSVQRRLAIQRTAVKA